MNKKAFTLIEVLAVIVIIGIVAFLAIPEVQNIIDKTNNKAFKASIEGLISSVKNEATSKYLIDNSYIGVYQIKDSEITNNKGFTYDGYLPDSGYFVVDQKGVVSLAIHDDNWCAIKNKEDKDITLTTYNGSCGVVPEISPTPSPSPSTPDTCFEFSSGTITNYLVGNTGCGVDVVIPSAISGQNVVKIGDYAFKEKDITSVIFPNTITEIGIESFYMNYISSINLPISLKTIGDSAFSINDLTSLVLPDSVISIGEDCFGFNDLNSVVLSKNLVEIESLSFCYNNLTSIDIPDNIIIIGSSAFEDNEFVNINIPSSVVTIEFNAFQKNKLTSVTIPSSVINIGWGAFNDNQLPDDQAFIYMRNSDGSVDNSILISYGGARRDNITLPTSITQIGNFAFSRNNLTSFVIPSRIRLIESFAFAYNNLSTVTFENGTLINTEGVDNYSFLKSEYSNNNLQNIIYPGSKLQDWNYAISGGELAPFTTGTVTNSLGNVVISAN